MRAAQLAGASIDTVEFVKAFEALERALRRGYKSLDPHGLSPTLSAARETLQALIADTIEAEGAEERRECDALRDRVAELEAALAQRGPPMGPPKPNPQQPPTDAGNGSGASPWQQQGDPRTTMPITAGAEALERERQRLANSNPPPIPGSSEGFRDGYSSGLPYGRSGYRYDRWSPPYNW
jgi:hypothetical protein